jgi:predicted nuclease with TOPRIM domain
MLTDKKMNKLSILELKALRNQLKELEAKISQIEPIFKVTPNELAQIYYHLEKFQTEVEKELELANY